MNKLFAFAVLFFVSQGQAEIPPARYWHAMSSNNAASASTSRLYLFGGDGGWQSGTMPLNDLWYYRVDTGSWTQIVASDQTRPTARRHVAWSCGGGQCVAAGGSNRTGVSSETWYYTESTNRWTQVPCDTDAVCPPARQMATMAYDSARSYHVQFGGTARSVTFSDTYTFDGKRWTLRTPSTVPRARRSAQMAFVPSHTSNRKAIAMDKLVMFGGQMEGVMTLCDIYSWNGANWQPIAASNQGPCVHSATMVWDTSSAVNPRLLVANGYVDVNDTRNTDFWYFTFDSETSGAWTKASTPPCSPRRDAMGAYDQPARTLVFFGGSDRDTTPYNDTLVCRFKGQ